MIRRKPLIGCPPLGKVSADFTFLVGGFSVLATFGRNFCWLGGPRCYSSRDSLRTGVEASAAQNAPVTKTCLQCGSILPRVSGSVLTDPELERARACTFCDSHGESPALSGSGNPTFDA